MTMENGRRRDLKRAVNSTTLNTKLFSWEGGKEGRGEMGERDSVGRRQGRGGERRKRGGGGEREQMLSRNI